MNTDESRVHGSRPIGALVPRVTRRAFRRRGPATAQVLIDWPGIVGPAIAAVASPQRMSRGVLTIACSGPIALELQHLAPEVMARINTHLGSQTVTALRFVQIAAPPASLTPLPPPPDPTKLALVDAAVAELPDGDLRAALVSLGHALATRRTTPATRGPGS